MCVMVVTKLQQEIIMLVWIRLTEMLSDDFTDEIKTEVGMKLYE